MAISKNIGFKGITVSQCYITAVTPTIGASKDVMSFGVQYRSAAGQEPFDAKTITAPYDLEGDNPIRQAYLHLKTLEEFSGAVDC